MPSVVATNGKPDFVQRGPGVTKFTNCLLVKGDDLVSEDLWVSSTSGKILNGQELLFEHRTAPDQIFDLGGRILSPGLIDTQLNGAYGFDFSVIPDDGAADYGKGVLRVNRKLVATGVTSYLPTMTSQRPEIYHEVCTKDMITRHLLMGDRHYHIWDHQAALVIHHMAQNPWVLIARGHL
jgi:N-acetylglucosamine-6-phosphate deacetylase